MFEKIETTVNTLQANDDNSIQIEKADVQDKAQNSDIDYVLKTSNGKHTHKSLKPVCALGGKVV